MHLPELIISGEKFAYICDISPIAEKNLPKEFLPQSNYLNIKKLPLNRYGAGPFCKFSIPNNQKYSGVYAITSNGAVKYIGRCESLTQRYNMGYGNISPRNCFKGGQETNCRINNLILQESKTGCNLSLYFLKTSEFVAVEDKLLKSEKPIWNRT